uniref:C2H2-type domain-containing protein n=1 Tax=Laticauda laticaudata TaxID=8630 RepID=A0A8C5SLB1_LATLA
AHNTLATEDRPPEIYSIALWGPKLHSALTRHRGGRSNAQASAPNSKHLGPAGEGDATDEGSLVLIDAEGVPHTVSREEVELAGQMQSSGPELLASAPPPRQLYFCPICLRTFLYQSDLERHSITHSESKPYICRECGKAFKRSSHLQRHKHIHTGERPFSCPVCRKGFRESGELLRHQRVHTGEKPYQCQICRLRFTERNTLRRHAKRKHALFLTLCPLKLSTSISILLPVILADFRKVKVELERARKDKPGYTCGCQTFLHGQDESQLASF